ncbi:MAG: FAD:protein FMN transferase [Myxococcales bacterium]|jgi:thiamine biosynthesis lipoprotein
MTIGSEERKFSRRALLAGGGALAVGAAFASRRGVLGLFAGGSDLEVARFAAMGTHLELTLPRGAGAAIQKAVGAVSAIERQMSVFLPDSELSRLNASATRARVAVSSELQRVLDESRRVHGLTDGAFDPTVGPLMSAWGFRQGRPTSLPRREALRASLERTGLKRVDSAASGVAFDAEGLGLDFGGIAKGYGADRAAEALRAAGMSGLVNVGGDIRSIGAQPNGEPWKIGVRNPVRAGEILASIELAPGQAVATSGTYEQRYSVEGREVTHILDPRSGEPVDGVVSATVVAATAMEADALATAACVLGADAALRLCGSMPGVEALFVARDGARYRVDATSGLKARMLGRV